MDKSCLITGLAVLLSMAAIPAAAQVQASGDAYLENPGYNVSGSGNVLYGNSYSVGNNFQVTGSIPSGDTLYVTALGYYAGTNGEFTGGGTVTANQTVALFGPGATDKSNLSGDQLAEVTVPAGTTVDANGFAWVALSAPVVLVAGDYYDILTTEGSSEAYLQPYDNGSSGNAAMVLASGSPFSIYEGAYASSITASEGYAYSDSTYLGPNMQYQIQGPAPLVSARTNDVNPNSMIVTNFQGWGTSLCWWANMIGSYANRTDYVNLAFNTLKLNIVRYNIGGGQNPTNTAIPGQGIRAIMQGFEPSPGIWNWNADTNQRWVLQQAEARGANLVDAFANSPPWWMCVDSNCDGNASATNNLQVNNETNFAIYLSTVVSNLTVLDGDHFNYLTPMNEPNGSEWTGTSQEGCDMNPSQQGTVVGILYTQLNTIAPSVGIDAAEDVDPYQTYNDLTSYTGSQLDDVALFTTHTYGFTGASDLQSEASSKNKTLWVTEHGDSDGTGMTMAREIYNDIDVMGARAWVYWQFCDETGSGWGCVENNLNGDGVETYTVQEKFYVMGQFSEFIRPGCNIISVNDTNTLAAWNPTNGTLVLVMVNNTSSSLNVTYNLSDFPSEPWQVSATQTDPSENMATLLPAPVVTNQAFTAAIPATSVTTFVLTTNVAVTSINLNPAAITCSLTNNQLSLGWPADHIGWTLQTQTNPLVAGLSTNWINVTGSSGTNLILIPINLTNGCVFYRLFYQSP